MNACHEQVFFYGLFMDERLLAKRGIHPLTTESGYVDDYQLVIGERATLIPCRGGRTYGLLMEVARNQVADLYADKSVADYVPETVSVLLADGRSAQANCYNLPVGKVAGANRDYARNLLALATQLGFPEVYLEQIRRASVS